jgi:hypothetical protein
VALDKSSPDEDTLSAAQMSARKVTKTPKKSEKTSPLVVEPIVRVEHFMLDGSLAMRREATEGKEEEEKQYPTTPNDNQN